MKRKKTAAPPPERKPGEWPDTCPILTGHNIVRKRWHAEDGVAHDLGGWLEVAFDCDLGYQTNPCYQKAFAALKRVLVERGAPPDLALWEICDDKRFKRGFLAKCWNETMRRLGFEVGAEDL